MIWIKTINNSYMYSILPLLRVIIYGIVISRKTINVVRGNFRIIHIMFNTYSYYIRHSIAKIGRIKDSYRKYILWKI